MFFYLGLVLVVVHVWSDFGMVPKTTSCTFFYMPSRVLGLVLFHGEMASYCMCGGNGLGAFEMALFVVDEMTSFPKKP